ncbi:hypothetical protein LTS18_009488 [Coniosporium uncinatum]|uniref:Uncharacterized protein n=1 Tax=Coniosporium uncinatum TaxID=93489 RepID=A0ACC3DM87_9PEZI|nr:hypothetical protein LTS18_009488 [Coniosporium uncinatum]
MSGSSLYQTLLRTAHDFVLSTEPLPDTSPLSPSKDRILAHRTPDMLTTWGHKHFVAQTPPLQGAKTTDEFLSHMSMMLPSLENVRIQVVSVIVDEVQKKAAVVSMFYMTPKGEGDSESRTVENEVLWQLQMTEDGGKVESAVEYVDPVASKRIGELIGEWKKSQG